MNVQTAENLRKAIESLINAKLHDALAKPGGLERLVAHRVTGVASWDVRNAERKLEEAISDALIASASTPPPAVRRPRQAMAVQ
jgi:hypothetical protein